MTTYFYWRCSTDYQDQERQILAAKEAGVLKENIFGDKVTGTSSFGDRPELTKCLEQLQSGDLLLVSEL